MFYVTESWLLKLDISPKVLKKIKKQDRGQKNWAIKWLWRGQKQTKKKQNACLTKNLGMLDFWDIFEQY